MEVILERLENDGKGGEWVYWGKYDTAKLDQLNSLVSAAAILGETLHKVRVVKVVRDAE